MMNQPIESSGKKRIAVITTVYTYLSHAQHFADRLMVGYPYAGKWRAQGRKLFVEILSKNQFEVKGRLEGK